MSSYDFLFLVFGFGMVVSRSTVGLLFIVFCWFLGQRVM